MSSVHDGHRSRMREKLKTAGLGALQDHEVLEWLLQYTIPRGDVNPLAHRLMRRFNGLGGVLSADYEKLIEVEGVGDTTALFLSNYVSVYKRYVISCESQKRYRFDSAQSLARYLVNRFVDCRGETLRLLCLDSSLCLLTDRVIGEGGAASVRLDTRAMIETCVQSKATFAVLAHNHPSQLLLPSKSDVETTRSAAQMLAAVQVRLLDHVIVGLDGCLSMAESKEFAHIFAR